MAIGGPQGECKNEEDCAGCCYPRDWFFVSAWFFCRCEERFFAEWETFLRFFGLCGERFWFGEWDDDGRRCSLRVFGVWSFVERVFGFHDEAEKGVGDVFVGFGGVVRTCGGEGEDAEEIGDVELLVVLVEDDPDVGGEVAVEAAVAREACCDGAEGVGRVEGEAGFEEEVAEFGDLGRIACGDFFEL